MRTAAREPLFYIYREPRKAKSLHLGVVPRAVDDYWQFRGNYAEQPVEQKLGNPVHHIHAGKVPEGTLPLTYGLLLNLVSLPGCGDQATAWKFVQRYEPDRSAETHAELDELIELAVNYARDFVAPSLPAVRQARSRRPPLRDSPGARATADDAAPETIQKHRLRSWQAPRLRPASCLVPASTKHSSAPARPAMGSFHRPLRSRNSRRLIAEALAAGG